jgi:putative spermidine/putrescine transport system permease protein
MADITASPDMAGRKPDGVQLETEQTGPIVAADGTPLKRKLAESMRQARWRAFLLTAPLLIFVVLTFMLPIGQMLTRSVHNDTFPANMPRVTEAIQAWDGETLPDESLYEAMVMDLRDARETRAVGRVATRVNYDAPGTRSAFTKAGRRAARMEPPFKDALIAADEEWGKIETWSAVKQAASAITPNFYLASVDRKRGSDGSIVMQDENRQIYVQLFVRTFWMSALITVLCLMLAYPVAYWLSVLPLRYSNLLMILVLSAVLDVVAGAHDRMDRHAAGRGGHQQSGGVDRSHRR